MNDEETPARREPEPAEGLALESTLRGEKMPPPAAIVELLGLHSPVELGLNSPPVIVEPGLSPCRDEGEDEAAGERDRPVEAPAPLGVGERKPPLGEALGLGEILAAGEDGLRSAAARLRALEDFIKPGGRVGV